MEKQTWWKEAVVYQIYPRSFKDSNGDGIGDLQGVISKLYYLADLGIDVIWLSPVYKSPNVDMGYDISDYQDIMDEFGSIEDMKELLDEAHKRNLKIVMDLVVNHTSDQHPWFIESRKSKDNPYRDYYIWKESGDGEPTNWGAFFNGSAWKLDDVTDEYYLHLYTEQQPDLNWDNPKVRQEVYGMMEWWCDLGVDGFRMDVINLISKPEVYVDHPVPEGHKYATTRKIIPNGPRVHDYIREMNETVLAKKDLITVGETPGGTTDEALKYTGFDRNELQMIFQFEHMEVDDDPVFGRWTDRTLELPILKGVMTKWQTELEGKAWNSLYWNNHDQPRIVSRWGSDDESYREISAKMLATCLHFMKGTPYVYQGEELGLINSPISGMDEVRDVSVLNAYNELVVEQELISKKDFFKYVNRRGRDNARTPMQWDGSPYGGFSENQPWIRVNPSYETINAEAQVGVETSVHSYYKQLIALRKKHKIMVYGKYELLEADHEKLYVYSRAFEGAKLMVICNFSRDTLEYQIPLDILHAQLLISNYDNNQTCTIRPYEARVYYLN